MGEEHPIEALMKTTMESIKQMVDVNTIVGDPVEVPDGSVIVPISKVALGFAAGGGEYDCMKKKDNGDLKGKEFPFAGGTGAGVSVQPVAFLVVGNGQIRLLSVDSSAIAERIIDVAPQIIQQVQGIMGKKNGKEEKTQSTVAPSM